MRHSWVCIFIDQIESSDQIRSIPQTSLKLFASASNPNSPVSRWEFKISDESDWNISRTRWDQTNLVPGDDVKKWGRISGTDLWGWSYVKAFHSTASGRMIRVENWEIQKSWELRNPKSSPADILFGESDACMGGWYFDSSAVIADRW